MGQGSFLPQAVLPGNTGDSPTFIWFLHSPKVSSFSSWGCMGADYLQGCGNSTHTGPELRGA